MIALGGITYAEQRSFLLTRVNDQARATLPAVEHRFDRDHRFGPRPGGPPDGGPGPEPLSLASGVYGEVRDPSGRVVDKGFLLGFGQTAPPAPKLPGSL